MANLSIKEMEGKMSRLDQDRARSEAIGYIQETLREIDKRVQNIRSQSLMLSARQASASFSQEEGEKRGGEMSVLLAPPSYSPRKPRRISKSSGPRDDLVREVRQLLELLQTGMQELQSYQGAGGDEEEVRQMSEDVEARIVKLEVLEKALVDSSSKATTNDSASDSASEFLRKGEGLKENACKEKEGAADEEKPRRTQREQIISEIISTEETYVKSLEILVKDFQQPLLAMAKKPNEKIVEQMEITLMFSNVDVIYDLHVVLLGQLHELYDRDEGKGPRSREQSMSGSAEDSGKKAPLNANYGQLFARIGPQFLPYVQYGQDYDDGIMRIKQLDASNPRLARFFAGKRSKQFKSAVMYLESLMITPIQRIPRYMMLLRELLKNTPEESVQERRGLEEGLKMMAKIGAVVNDVCKANNMVQTDFEHVVNFRTHKMPLVGTTLNAKITINSAYGLKKKSDAYCVVSVGQRVYTTSTRKETSEPEWNEVWVIEEVHPSFDVAVDVYHKSLVHKSFLGGAKGKLFPPVNVVLTAEDLVEGKVIAKKRQNLALHPRHNKTDVDITGSVNIVVEILIGKQTDPKSLDSRTFSTIWRTLCPQVSVEVPLADSTAQRLFDDILSSVQVRFDIALCEYFLRLLAIPGVEEDYKQARAAFRQTRLGTDELAPMKMNLRTSWSKDVPTLSGKSFYLEYYQECPSSRWLIRNSPQLFFYLVGHTRRLILHPRLPRGVKKKGDKGEKEDSSAAGRIDDSSNSRTDMSRSPQRTRGGAEKIGLATGGEEEGKGGGGASDVTDSMLFMPILPSNKDLADRLRPLDIIIGVIGAAQVGKSSFIKTFTTAKPCDPNESYVQTLMEETKFSCLYRPPPDLSGQKDWLYRVNFRFVDCGSQLEPQRVKNLSEVVGLPSMPHVYMVMFSWKIGKGKEDEFSRSLDTIMRTWVPFMSQTINPTDSKFSINRPGMILVGNKVDMFHQDCIDVNSGKSATELITDLAGTLFLSQYFETSCCTLEGLQEAMGRAVEITLAHDTNL